MTIQVHATYADGAFRPTHPLPLAEGTEVTFEIRTEPPSVAASPIDLLAEVIGIGTGPTAGDVAAKHDDYLYGAP